MKARRNQPADGATLLELMVVLAIIGALASIAMPRYAVYQEKARAAHCLANRYHIEMAERTYFLEHNAASLEVDAMWSCPSGGVYAWIVSDPRDPAYPKVICSVHGEAGSGEVDTPLTSLGSTFEEIISAMIGLIQEAYLEDGRYPRSWGDYRFTDIGLDPEEWNTGYDGIVYTPMGDSIAIEPDEDFVFVFTDSKGRERELSSKSKWDLVYSIEDSQWYYRSVKRGNEIDISTLKILRD